MTAKAAKQDVEAVVAELARTPRSNRDLEQKLAGFKTIAEGLDYAARGLTGFNFYSAKGVLSHVLTFAELRSRALATARKLVSAGLKRGDRVAVIAETGPEFMAVFFGCQYAGLVPCPDALHHVYRRARMPMSSGSPACCARRRPVPSSPRLISKGISVLALPAPELKKF